MQKMNVKKETGFTRYIIIGDLYQEGHGEMPVGKARITFFIPRKKEELENVKGGDASHMVWPETLTRQLEMAVLFFNSIEKGWVEYFINEDDILQEKVDLLEPDATLIVNTINEYLTENGFGLWVR